MGGTEVIAETASAWLVHLRLVEIQLDGFDLSHEPCYDLPSVVDALSVGLMQPGGSGLAGCRRFGTAVVNRVRRGLTAQQTCPPDLMR